MAKKTTGRPNAQTIADPAADGLVVYQHPGQTEGVAVANTLLNPQIDAACTADRWMHPPGSDPGPAGKKAGLMDFAAVLAEQVKSVNGGDLSKAEGMLMSQASTLNIVFNHLMRQTLESQSLQLWEARMRVALRAQNQCRMTLETLAEIKNPRPVAFVKQANISAGPQQVNNGTSAGNGPISSPIEPARAEETQMPQTKLLTEGTPNELDTGTSSTPGRANPLLATVGEVDRSQDREGQGSRRAKRLEGRHAADDARAGKGAPRSARGADAGQRRVADHRATASPHAERRA